jgi:hypothetical protein
MPAMNKVAGFPQTDKKGLGEEIFYADDGARCLAGFGNSRLGLRPPVSAKSHGTFVGKGDHMCIAVSSRLKRARPVKR